MIIKKSTLHKYQDNTTIKEFDLSKSRIEHFINLPYSYFFNSLTNNRICVYLHTTLDSRVQRGFYLHFVDSKCEYEQAKNYKQKQY